jgi:Zn-dependent metalloprotease
MCQVRNPLHCVVPPTVLEEVARRGSDAQRDWALRTLSRDHTIRSARIQNARRRGRGPREGADTLAQRPPGQMTRQVYDCESEARFPLRPTRVEGEKESGDEAVDEAYNGFGDTHRFLWEIHHRDSIDDEGMPLRGYVHYGEDYDNAFWDGRRMVFGDGDGELFVRFTRSLDVIGHELGHGVTEDEAGLEYYGQSGALNESMSDVFGSLVKQYKLGQSAEQASWLIGDDIIGQEVEGEALRSMKAPGTAYDDDVLGRDPQPAHMDDFVVTTRDNAGVHINSGIPNHAFYVVATTLGGSSWERAGVIWYETLRDPLLRANADFQTFADLSCAAAARLYGADGEEAVAVRAGWEKVGIELAAALPAAVAR